MTERDYEHGYAIGYEHGFKEANRWAAPVNVDLLSDVAAHLAAAISLLERTPKTKKAAPSDKMFDQMLVDYKNSLTRARVALSHLSQENISKEI